MNDFSIRSYEEKDRIRVREICANTGFLGSPIDPIFSDRDLFSKMIVDPYLNLEPRHTIVGVVDGVVRGYFMGATDPKFGIKSAPYFIKGSLEMILKTLTGKYNNHPRSKEYVKWLFTQGVKEIPYIPSKSTTAHVNVESGYSGIGIPMKDVFEDTIRNEGICEYFGRVFLFGKRTVKSYVNFGFEEIEKKEFTAFKKELGERKAYKVSVRKKL